MKIVQIVLREELRLPAMRQLFKPILQRIVVVILTIRRQACPGGTLDPE